ADAVDELSLQGLVGGKNAAIEGGFVARVHGGPLPLHDHAEAVVKLVGHVLQPFLAFRRQRGGQAAHVDVLAALDRLAGDIEHTHQVLHVEEIEDDADAAGDGGGVGDDEVAGGGKVIGAAAAVVQQAGDHGLVALVAIALQFLPHDVHGR